MAKLMNRYKSMIKNVATLTKDEDEKTEKLVLPEIIQGAHRKSTGRKYSLCHSKSKETNQRVNPRLSVPIISTGKQEYKADNNTRYFATPSTVKRESFKSLGAQIKRLVRVRKAFMIRDEKREKDDSIYEEFFCMNEEKLPNEPRMSTFMSPEAMYAVMKGYEDTAHYYLSQSTPECTKTLKRSQTYTSFVKIKPNSDITTKSNIDTQVNEQPYSSRSRKGQSSRFRCLTPISRDKQIELSFRLQNVMDIVDSVKSDLGYYITSPRKPLSIKALQNPAQCYNKWTDIWKEEFNAER